MFENECKYLIYCEWEERYNKILYNLTENRYSGLFDHTLYTGSASGFGTHIGNYILGDNKTQKVGKNHQRVILLSGN